MTENRIGHCATRQRNIKVKRTASDGKSNIAMQPAETIVEALVEAGPLDGQRVVLSFLVSFADFGMASHSRKIDKLRAIM